MKVPKKYDLIWEKTSLAVTVSLMMLCSSQS